MSTARILSPFAGSGSIDDLSAAFRPLVALAYPFSAWTDVTNIPNENLLPDPNLVVIEASLDPDTLATIESDPAFVVLWSE